MPHEASPGPLPLGDYAEPGFLRRNVSPLLVSDDIASLLRVSPWTVRRLIRSGQLRATRVGRRYLVRMEDVAAYLADHVVSEHR